MTVDDLDSIAGGDEARARMLRASLHRLADGPEGLLREMARGVLNGDISLRDAVASDVYGGELIAPFRKFWATYEQMTPEEREQLAAEGAGQP